MRCLVAAIALVLVSSSSSQAGIVYTAARAVGSGSVNLSLETDGTLGVLGAANIIDWTISMTDGPDSFTLFGPLSGNNSVSLVVGTALTATATDLFFNFDAGGNQHLLIQHPFLGAGTTFWSVQTNGSFDFAGPAEAIDPRFDFSFVKTGYSGNRVIASVQTAEVPEPASLSLLAIGGAVMAFGWRRRR